jgi:murein DD-endopeptidase MepM/ murein hydrolase activator NlpD
VETRNRRNKFAVIADSLLKGSWRLLSQTKRAFQQGMFWGRGNLYKKTLHISILFLTIAIFASGLLNIRYAKLEAQALQVQSGTYGNSDLLQQGSTVASVTAIEEAVNFIVTLHRVKGGETIKSIAKKYDLTEDTIVWANDPILSYYAREVNPSMTLKIPEMNGVLKKVESSDTLQGILSKTKGNEFDVIQLNNLVPPKYSLKGKKYIFVPDGTLPAPVGSQIGGSPAPDNSGYISPGFSGAALGSLPKGFFDDPLTHPKCVGYRWFRGYRPGRVGVGHTGVDLGKSGGCPIRAAGNGRVSFVGILDGNAGFTVVIDHGSGVQTHYYHGSGLIWVRTGQTVKKGQAVMYMGCSGNCHGTHLHLTLKYNGTIMDPAPYIPYRR